MRIFNLRLGHCWKDFWGFQSFLNFLWAIQIKLKKYLMTQSFCSTKNLSKCKSLSAVPIVQRKSVAKDKPPSFGGSSAIKKKIKTNLKFSLISALRLRKLTANIFYFWQFSVSRGSQLRSFHPFQVLYNIQLVAPLDGLKVLFLTPQQS